MSDKIDMLYYSESVLEEKQLNSIQEYARILVASLSWFLESRLAADTKTLLAKTFFECLEDPDFRSPQDLVKPDQPLKALVELIFAEFVFGQLWASRDNLTREEADLLYTLILPELKSSKVLRSENVPDYQREDLVIGFIADKILTPIHVGNDSSDAWLNVRRRWHLKGWMNRYVIDYLRAVSRESNHIVKEADSDKVRLESMPAETHIDFKTILTEPEAALAISKDEWEPSFLSGARVRLENTELLEVRTVLEKYRLRPDFVIGRCSAFLDESEEWVRLLLANAASEKSIALSKFGDIQKIRSVQYKAAHLGIISKKTYPSGSKNSHDYHESTLLGQWMAEVLGVDIPLNPDLIEAVFKIICAISLEYTTP